MTAENNGFTHKDGVSLKEYVDRRFEHINEKFDDTEKTTELVRVSMEHRLDGMNEFRESLRDQGNTFLPRKEARACFDAMKKDIRELREYKAALEGKASQRAVISVMIISIISLIVGIVGIVIRVA